MQCIFVTNTGMQQKVGVVGCVASGLGIICQNVGSYDYKDASRVLRCWKCFLPLFKATGHKNYSFEAFYCDRGHQKRKVELRNTTTFHFH